MLVADATLLAYFMNKIMSGRQSRTFNLTQSLPLSHIISKILFDQFNDSVQYVQTKQETNTYKKISADEN